MKTFFPFIFYLHKVENSQHFVRSRLRSQVTDPCFKSFNDGSSITISYLPDTNEILYIANVTATSFLAMGYGSNMVNTDMVAWIADGPASYQSDLYSVQEQEPTVLAINSYTTSFVDYGSYVVFTSTRSMTATGDDTFDIPLETQFSMVFAFLPGVT